MSSTTRSRLVIITMTEDELTKKLLAKHYKHKEYCKNKYHENKDKQLQLRFNKPTISPPQLKIVQV